MVDLLAFLKEYYILLVLALLFLVLVLELIVILVKPKNNSILSAIDKMLPEVIIAAEERFSNGSDKLNYVLLSIEDYIASLFDIKNVKQYEKYIKTSTEKILSCPQKKEVSNNG